jgi:hypothetical protein
MCSETPSVIFLPLLWGTEFHTHSKLHSTLQFHATHCLCPWRACEKTQVSELNSSKCSPKNTSTLNIINSYLFVHLNIEYKLLDHTIAQVVTRWFLNQEPQVQSQGTSRKFPGGRNHTGPTYLRVSLVSPFLNIIPPLLHTYLSPPTEVCDNPDQAAPYHILGL